MDKILLLKRYISFLLKSGNEHSIHSPFVFDLYNYAIKPRKQFYIFKEIEKLRTSLLNSSEVISINDFGAGSKINNSRQRKVRDIARHSIKSKELAQLLFRLTVYLKPNVIFDLGTSLGITTLYLATANTKAKIYSFEGCPETAGIAKKNFEKFKNNQIEVISGNLDTTLKAALQTQAIPDLVFFDANHRYEPTIQYFNQLLEFAGENTCFIFDDIHWSEEMEIAWKEISQHPKVTVSIDLFYLGIVFFRNKQVKEHFVLRR